MKINFKKTLAGCAFAVALAIPATSLLSLSTQAPTERTGSPSDGASCVACHSTFPVQTVNDLITSDIPQSGYLPGETYSITVSGMEQPLAQKYGFSMTAENAAGTKMGSFTAGDNSAVSGDHIGHSPASTSSTPSWTFSWTAPASGNGTITFYVASVVADGTGSQANDAVLTSNVAFTENTGSSINSISKDDFDTYVYGNQLTINNSKGLSIKNILISNGMGQIVKQQAINNANNILNLEVSNLKSGVYFVLIETNIGTISKNVFK